MRGKLRDKPTNTSQYRMRRELMERRRPPRRENRAANLLNQQWEEEIFLLDPEPCIQGISTSGNKRRAITNR